jgi:hypothetical protein
MVSIHKEDNMQKWEYLEVYTGSLYPPNKRKIDTVNGEKPKIIIYIYDYISQIGLQSWELIIGNGNYLIFKRPIE